MNTLFPIEPQLPEGFLYIPNFITGQEEIELVTGISKLELQTFIFLGFEKIYHPFLLRLLIKFLKSF